MPTVSPWTWLPHRGPARMDTRQHPEMLPVTADGTQLSIGSRRHYCPHNRDYHIYAKRIALELAERYKDHPALVMWHVDDEYACHFGEYFCAQSASAFRAWLQERYHIPLNSSILPGARPSGARATAPEMKSIRRARAFINPSSSLIGQAQWSPEGQ